MLCVAMAAEDDQPDVTLGPELGESMVDPSEGDDTLADAEPILPADGRLERGDELGRYVVLERIGKGAMGVVYAAYDPELDRKIALKLLRPAIAGGKAARERLLREARAMAKVSHANVATVHDVGMVSDRIFIAMEFIAGSTLSARTGDPDWRTTLDLYLAAGRGLAAAHDHDLVHRDFKPDNVLVGEDGRVRVVDFGIARRGGDKASELAGELASEVEAPLVEGGVEQTHSSEGVDEPSLTRTGALMGTPSYMSPEQHLGRIAGPASDQFSYCVSLWHALYGQRPFAGDTHATLAFQVCHGDLVDPPRSSVPSWIRAHLERGLARDPGRRHPSMNALLLALETPPKRRAPWVVTAALMATVGAAGWALADSREVEPCSSAVHQLDEVWNDERRAAIEARFDASGQSYSQRSWDSTANELDAWGSRWVAMKIETCRATIVRGEQSQALMDLRMLCLDRRLAEMRAAVEMLAEADGEVVERSVGVVHQLSDLEACADIDRLSIHGGALGERPDSIHELEQQLARATAMGRARKFDQAAALAGTVVEAAEAVGHQPFVAEAQHAHGYHLGRVGETERAERTLLSAAMIADRVGADRLRAEAWIDLVELHGIDLGESDLARSEAEMARAAITRAGGDQRLEARLEARLGRIALHEGEARAAKDRHAKALELRQQALGADHPDVATSLSDLGTAERDLGEFEKAEEHQRRALELRKRTLGDGHPDVGRSLTNIGNLRHAKGDYVGALEHHSRAIEVFESALGADHIYVGKVESNRANALLELGRHQQAADAYARSLKILEAILGGDSLALAISLDNHSVALNELGRHGEAFETGSRALEIRRQALGEDHVAVATNVDNLGRVLSAMPVEERPATPESYHLRAIEILERTLEPRDVQMMTPWINLGLERLGRGDRRGAEEAIVEANTIADAHPERYGPFVAARTALVRLRSAQRREADARVVARETIASIESAKRDGSLAGERVELDELEAWLAEHP